MAFSSLSSYNNKSTRKVLLLSRRGDSSSEWTCRIDYCYAALGDCHSSSSPKIKKFRGPLWWRSRRYHPTTTKAPRKVLLLSRRSDSSSEWTCRIDYCYAALGDRHSSSSPKIKNFRGPLWWCSRCYHPTTTKAPRKVLLLSRRGDSNARPPRPERGALPTALLLVLWCNILTTECH